tara:strand:- start:472 stop:1032 length:561 start_codon:yes stop_codon:yes gene_type:complete
MPVEPMEVQVARLSKKLLKISAKDVPASTSSALTKTARKVKTRLVSGVARSERLPAKVVRKKVYVKGSTIKKQKSKITVYRDDVSVASLLTKATISKKMGTGTNRRGVTVRGRNFPGAFIQRAFGSTQVFAREGRARNPIEKQVVVIKDAVDKIAPIVTRRVYQKEFLPEVKRELKFRLERTLAKK